MLTSVNLTLIAVMGFIVSITILLFYVPYFQRPKCRKCDITMIKKENKYISTLGREVSYICKCPKCGTERRLVTSLKEYRKC